jgi:hypothetical protein
MRSEAASSRAALEEARRTARLDSFLEGPEVMARQRLAEFRDKKRVLTAAQETMFRFLALLYPAPPRPTPSKEMIEQHPFSTQWPYPYIVGNPNYPEPEKI